MTGSTQIAFESQLAELSEPMRKEVTLSTAPMRTLGTLVNPPWALLDLHTDHLGTVRLITDQSGTVVSEHKYFPFGESTTSEPPAPYNSHKFTGHERDAESEMDYMLHNNPLKFIDPSGSVVEDVKLKTEGQNAVANPSTTEGTALSSEAAATLGPEETATSVLYSVNVEATVSAGDSPGNYQFNQQSYAVQTVNGSPSASAKPNDSPAAANTTTTGNKAVMYDAPGVKMAGTTRLGNTIEFSGAFKTTAVDKGTGQQSGPTLYWGVTIKQGPDGVTKNTAGPITPQAFEKVKQLATAGGK